MKKKLCTNPIFVTTLLATYCILYMLLLSNEVPTVKAIADVFGIRKVVSHIVVLSDFLAIGIIALIITTKNFFHTYNQSKNTVANESFILLPLYLLYCFTWFLLLFNVTELLVYISFLSLKNVQ